MTNRTLYLFPDTNVFIQCRPLNEVDWSEWIAYDEIHLIVCQPVQRELDKHKNRGNDRVGKRARKTCSRFRQLILNNHDYELIRQSRPRVVLSLGVSSSQGQTPLASLDYSTTDDQLVGCVYTYWVSREGLDVGLLTHDTGPMMTAKSIQLPFVAVPDSWLLPPEPNKAEKEVGRLEQELARHRAPEARFQTRFLDEEENEIETIDIECVIYAPLSDDDLTTLIERLETRFPIATDFGHREPIERVSPLRLKEVYEPAADEEIDSYTTGDYPAWLAECRNVFANLHNVLQQQERSVFRFGARNEGSRPGRNVLVVISSKGYLKIRPPQIEGEYSDTDDWLNLQLVEPPKAPQGEWKSVWNSLFPFGKGLLAAGNLQNRLPDPDSLLGNMDLSRDPDAFYYKPSMPNDFVESFALECEQWRHGLAEEVFDVEMHVNGDREEISGVLECEIHAENLPTPSKSIIPVRITVRRVSVRDYAFQLVDGLAVGTHEST